MPSFQTNMRLDPETREKIVKLSCIWGNPVNYECMTMTDVVRECVRRVHETETKTKERL